MALPTQHTWNHLEEIHEKIFEVAFVLIQKNFQIMNFRSDFGAL